MNIRRIRPGEGSLLREVRLRALLTDPDAFGSSYEREASHGVAWWEERARSAASGDQQYFAVAEDGTDIVGIVGAYTPEGASHERHLVSTWVAPGTRGNGLGMGLVDAVVEWACAGGASEVTLWVVDGNLSATALYEEAGFAATGERQPLPSNPKLMESLMALRLR